ncbi:reverse transcriptase domain-containing protein [Tanacetum coccineum]
MSSPDHPTANLEDVFSSNFPNYVPPASPDYVPASPGKTYSSASNLFGIVLLASPTLSLFPMSTIDATWEQILDILNSLDAIPIERIEHIENGIEGLEKGNNASKKLKLRPMAFSASQYRQETPGPTGTPAVKMGNYKEFISCNITTFNEEAINIRPRTNGQVTMQAPMQVSSDNKESLTTNELYKSSQQQQTTATPTIDYNNRQTTLTEGKKLVGHLSKNCRNKKPATGSNQLPVTVVCHACGEKGHYTNQCRKTNINAQGRAYMLKDRNAQQDQERSYGFYDVVIVMEKKSDEKGLEDIPVVKEFPDVFLEDLPGLPPVRQVEFQIDLINPELALL